LEEASVEIDRRILRVIGSKNRGHVGGRRHKSRRNVKLFKSINLSYSYKEKEKRKEEEKNIKTRDIS
jgi:hypothetical protein